MKPIFFCGVTTDDELVYGCEEPEETSPED